MNCKKNKLQLFYNKSMRDFVISYPNKLDGNLIFHHILSDILLHSNSCNNEKKYPFNFDVFNFKDELEKRGYDLTTLKFSIELKDQS